MPERGYVVRNAQGLFFAVFLAGASQRSEWCRSSAWAYRFPTVEAAAEIADEYAGTVEPAPATLVYIR